MVSLEMLDEVSAFSLSAPIKSDKCPDKSSTVRCLHYQNTDHSGILRDHQIPGDDYLMIGCVAGVMVTLVTEKNSSVV